jgi:hypothetical protein
VFTAAIFGKVITFANECGIIWLYRRCKSGFSDVNYIRLKQKEMKWI